MKKIIIQKREIEKKNLMNETIIQANQRNCINQLFLDEQFDGRSEIERELKKKLNSYKTQLSKDGCSRHNLSLF